MRILLSIVLAAGVGFGAAYFFLVKHQRDQLHAAHSAAEAAWQAEKAALEKALADANNKPATVQRVVTTERVAVAASTNLSAQEIIDRLIQLRPGGGEESRNRVMRQIVHQLQLLVEIGQPALPVIRQFLSQNQDVDYTSDEIGESGERANRSDRWMTRSLGRTDFLVPPSLRLGLVDALDQIGGEASEQIMAEMLQTTGRGVEVAFLARLLQENAPNKYRDTALTAAKELLSNPPPIDQPNRIDENARAYLYQVLAMYNDTSFAQTAQTMLLSADGHVDRQAMNYLTGTLKEQSLPALCQAYKDPRLTNQWEKSNLMNTILNFTGLHAPANQVFDEIVNNAALPAAVRALTVQSIAGGWRSEAPRDPAIIKSRLQLLETMRGNVKEDRIRRAIDEATFNLEQLQAGVQGPALPVAGQRNPKAAPAPPQ